MNPFCEKCDDEGIWYKDFCFCPRCGQILARKVLEDLSEEEEQHLSEEFLKTRAIKGQL